MSHKHECWLQHQKIKNDKQREEYIKWFSTIVIQEKNALIETAQDELRAALSKMLQIEPNVTDAPQNTNSLVIGTIHTPLVQQVTEQSALEALNPEGYLIKQVQVKEREYLILTAKTGQGILYGAFHLLRLLQMGHAIRDLELKENPTNQLRLINQWDNFDGSIERGYAGNSIFYKNNKFTSELERVKDYARLLCSVGINGIAINNVNVHQLETKFITQEYLSEVAEMASIFRGYGITLFLSINYASPISLGDLDTADPLEESVRSWWKKRTEEIYQEIPDFGGFLVKADSEGRPGPFTYDRDHADGANMLAEAVAPYGGLVIWRCFVYNCLQDWRDRSTDRARAAYDHFTPLDGRFRENVILQIKNGPVDFQVREPVSPLFGAMPNTNQMMEFQITQEYTGQQKHLCYLIPQWKEALEFDTYAQGEGSTVKSIVDGSLYQNKYSGIAAVSNIGLDDNWTGHSLAQANLFGYGRLTWNPDLSTEKITEEWIKATFGSDPEVMEVISEMLHSSWRTYESYTAPLGVGWMVTPHYHYGPDVDGYEYSRWGTYHFADREGIGVDRTKATGTGYSQQYVGPNAEMYDNLESCPDELILFFHHVPYTHQLKSGVSVIQHIYNTHFEGVEQAEALVHKWSSLAGKIDQDNYKHTLGRLQEQAEHSKEWRDIINTYFFRKSGINDQLNRRIY